MRWILLNPREVLRARVMPDVCRVERAGVFYSVGLVDLGILLKLLPNFTRFTQN